MGHEEAHAVREALERNRREPRILCWNCKRLTPFYEDRCTNCGAKFAGSTGGVYSAPARIVRPTPSPPRDELVEARRSLVKLFEDLQRVHDVASRYSEEIGRYAAPKDQESVTLFQCPACGRFVSEDARECVCGVHFASGSATSACPDCGSQIPGSEAICPVCRAQIAPAADIVYQCPRCGARVAADASLCDCGARFAD